MLKHKRGYFINQIGGIGHNTRHPQCQRERERERVRVRLMIIKVREKI